MTRLERTAAETKATRIASFRHYALNLADFADHMQARGVDSAVGPARTAAKLANETANANEHNDLEAARQARADYGGATRTQRQRGPRSPGDRGLSRHHLLQFGFVSAGDFAETASRGRYLDFDIDELHHPMSVGPRQLAAMALLLVRLRAFRRSSLCMKGRRSG